MESYFDMSIIKVKILYLLYNFKHKEKVKKIGVFGSVARGEANVNSNIDLVLDYEYDDKVIEKKIITEVKKRFAFEQSLRDAFDPVPLSIVDINTLIEQGDYMFKENIERDVIWLYNTENIKEPDTRTTCLPSCISPNCQNEDCENWLPF